MRQQMKAIQAQQGKIQQLISSVKGEVKELRKAISDKRQEIEAVKSADFPLKFAVANFTNYVDSKAASSGFSSAVQGLMRPNHERPQTLFNAVAKTAGTDEFTDADVDIDSALCFLFKDELIQKFKEVAEQELAPGLPLDERKTKVKTLNAELDELERAEEELIVESAANGITIERRADVRPEIILEWQD